MSLYFLIFRINANHGPTFRKMSASMTAGYAQADCDVLFDSCPIPEVVMIEYIEKSVRHSTDQPA